MGARLGLDGKLYRQTTGVRAAWPASGSAPNLDEVENVRDVTLNLEHGEADVTSRNNDGFRTVLATLKDASVEFEMIWNPADPDFAAIRDAWLNQTDIAMAVLDGDKDTPGSQGLWADWQIINFTRSEPLEEGMVASVTARPSGKSDLAPEWAVTGT